LGKDPGQGDLLGTRKGNLFGTMATCLRQALLGRGIDAGPARIVFVAMMFIGIFSGRYSFDRFFDDSLGVWWLQMRIWATALAVIAAYPLLRGQGPDLARGYSKEETLWFWLAGLFYVYLAGNALVQGDPEGVPIFFFDTLLILVQATLIAFVVRSTTDICLFAWIAEIVALALIVFRALGFGNPELYGLTFAPFGNPITIYRLEFFGFCSALYLGLARSEGQAARLTHGLAAALTLYATFASLSRAATLAALTVTGMYCLWFLSRKEYRTAASLVVITALGLVGMLTFSAALENRFATADPTRIAAAATRIDAHHHGAAQPIDGVPIDYAVMQANGRILDVLARYYRGEVSEFDDLDVEQRRYLEAVAYVNEGALPDPRKDLGMFLFAASRLVTVGDGSSRIGMAIQAWRDFALKPWFGIGLDNYRYYIPLPEKSTIILEKYPHNIILEMLSGLGLVGAAMFAVALAGAMLLAFRLAAESPPLVFMAGYLAFVFFTALFSGNIFDFRLVWLVTIAMVASSRSIQPRATNG